MKMFSPFPSAETAEKAKAASGEEGSLRELTDRLNALQQQIETLTNKRKGQR
jgi:polyhydroxyalkanoate synthesis regulator protein